MVMVRIPIGDSQAAAAPSISAEDVGKRAVAKVVDIVFRSEKMLSSAIGLEKAGDINGSRALKKRARDKARLAMKLMGPVHFGLGIDMSEPGSRARAVFMASRVNGV